MELFMKGRSGQPGGQLTLGVAYYPDYLDDRTLTSVGQSHRFTELGVEERIVSDLRRMEKNGIKLIRMGEFSWSHVESRPGVYTPQRFLYTLDQAHALGIQVMMCTPTATPPKWLVDSVPDILPMTRKGDTIPFGGRRHYDHCHPRFIEASLSITTAFAKTFGKHPAVVAWQIDNELGNHGSSMSYTRHALNGFREWLRQEFQGNIKELNRQWFTSFWSQTYQDFFEVPLPLEGWADVNPHLELAFKRYMTVAYQNFQQGQIDILRNESPGRLITHNITPMLFDLCWWTLSQKWDVVGYDHYQMRPEPDPFSSASQFHLMRSLKGGKPFMVLEQQPVQVNWQPINRRYSYDWLFLWSIQAHWLGASHFCYFSWQKFYGGAEKYHDGIIPHDVRIAVSPQEKVLENTNAYLEKIAAILGETSLTLKRDVLLVMNFESVWTHDLCRQSEAWNGIQVAEDIQRALNCLGLCPDMVPSIEGADLSQYRYIIFPGYAFELSDEERQSIGRFIESGGKVISFPRSFIAERSGRMSPLPLRFQSDGDVALGDAGAMLVGEADDIDVILDHVVHHVQGHLWAESYHIVDQSRWQACAHFRSGPFAGGVAAVQMKNESGGGWTHLGFYPVLDVDGVEFIRKILGLKPEVAGTIGQNLQVFPFTGADGSNAFGVINFASSLGHLTIDNMKEYQIISASLPGDLNLDFRMSDAGWDGVVEGRSVTVVLPRQG